MANPTGSTYLQANSGYTWTDGDVYQIPQTDQQEGAGTGASFSGLGVDNQPHQVLLNKIQKTHVNQLADEANITILQTFKALFTSGVAPTAMWFQVGVHDSSRGDIDVIVNCGKAATVASGGGTGTLVFNLPKAFPNAAVA